MKREQCAVGTAVFITGGIANGHVGTIESSHGRQYPIVRYGCTAVGVDPSDMEEFTIERADEIITALRKRVEALEGAIDDMLSEFDADEFGSEGQMRTCARARDARALGELK